MGDLLRFVKQLVLAVIVLSVISVSGEVNAQQSSSPIIVPPTPRAGTAPAPTPRPSGPRVNLNAAKVSDILVEGTQRIEPDTVRSYMALKQDEPFSSRKLNESLKTLYATGLFADVTIRRQGTAIVVQVVENPIINRIAFEGNTEIEDDPWHRKCSCDRELYLHGKGYREM